MENSGVGLVQRELGRCFGEGIWSDGPGSGGKGYSWGTCWPAARCAMRTGCLAPAGAEVMTVLLAIQLCRELGCLKVHMEGDAKGVIDAIHSEEVDRSWMGHKNEDIKVELKSKAHWQLTFVKREGNNVAHNLAKFALKNCISDTWHDAPPACISETLLLEQSALGL
jgi:hypothetical protein